MYPLMFYDAHPDNHPPQDIPHDMNWNDTTHTTPPMNSASSVRTNFFTIGRQPEGFGYVHPPHPDPTPFVPPPHPDSFSHPQLTPYHQHPAHNPFSFNSSQVDSSIGPARNTRRRTRAAAELEALQATDSQTHASNYSYERPQQSSFVDQPQHVSRPPTPIDTQPLSIPGMTPYMMDPAAAHPYSPYTFVPSHSRSTSGSGPVSGSASASGSHNQRSASPALSVASAVTSVSAGSGPRNPAARTRRNEVLAAPPVKHRKQKLMHMDRKKICLYAQENPTMKQEDVAAHFGVERSTVSKILKQKEKWLAVRDDETFSMTKMRPTKFPALENRLVVWLFECRDEKFIITDAAIRTKAREVADELCITEDKFKASSGWIENFKNRHGIRRGVFGGYPWKRKSVPGSDKRAGQAPETTPQLDPSELDAMRREYEQILQENRDDAGTQENGVHEDGVQNGVQEDGVQDDALEDDSSLRPAGNGESCDGLQPHASPPPPPEPIPLSEPIPVTITDAANPEVSYSLLPQYEIRHQAKCPTMQEAEECWEKVMLYIDREFGLLNMEDVERQALCRIQFMLFQQNSGVPISNTF